MYVYMYAVGVERRCLSILEPCSL